MPSLLEVKNLHKTFPILHGVFRKKIGEVWAVKNCSFAVQQGEVLGIVGESGSGKTTLGRIAAGFLAADSGEVLWEEKDIRTMARADIAQQVQMIFQDPFASLNPKLSIGTILAEAVWIRHKTAGEKLSHEQRKDEVKNLLSTVGMPTDILWDYPHQFSGGQRQRIGIARALAMRPKLIVADEPVSSLDLSIQAQILNLLMDLKEQFHLSFLFISHDLAVVNAVSNRILVMREGEIVEQGTVEDILQHPQKTYTQTLLAAVPAIPELWK